MRQAKVDPASLEPKLKDAVSALVEPLGPEAIVVSGAVVSAGGGGGGLSVSMGTGGLVGRGRWRWDLGRSPIRW